MRPRDPQDQVDTVNPTTGQRKANLRTALVFASIAIVFFVGIIVAQAIGGPVIGVGVMGAVVLLFLAFAIGRSLRVGEGGESRGPKGASPIDRGGRHGDSCDPPPSARGPRQ